MQKQKKAMNSLLSGDNGGGSCAQGAQFTRIFKTAVMEEDALPVYSFIGSSFIWQ